VNALFHVLNKLLPIGPSLIGILGDLELDGLGQYWPDCDYLLWWFVKYGICRNNRHMVGQFGGEIRAAVKILLWRNTGCNYGKFQLTSANGIGWTGITYWIYFYLNKKLPTLTCSATLNPYVSGIFFNNCQLYVCFRVSVFSCKLSLCTCAEKFHKECYVLQPIQQATVP
jgi:hypothetical protein